MKNDQLLAAGEVGRLLNVPVHRIQNLFDTHKLNDADFPRVSGRRLFTGRDVERIAHLLGVEVPAVEVVNGRISLGGGDHRGGGSTATEPAR